MAAASANSQSEAWTVVEPTGESDQMENFEIIQPVVRPQTSAVAHHAPSTQFLRNLRKIVLRTSGKRKATATSSADQPDYELLSNLLFCWFIVVNLVLTTVFSQLMRQDLKIQHYLNSTRDDLRPANGEKEANQATPMANNIIPKILAKYLDLDQREMHFESNVQSEHENILTMLKQQAQELKGVKSDLQELKLHLDQIQYDVVKQIVDFKNEITSADHSLRQHSTAWSNFVNMVNLMAAEMQKRNMYPTWMDGREQRSL